MTDLIRISTPEATFYFQGDDVDVALRAYGREAGYRSFDDLAFQLGKQADEARAELAIASVNYADIVEPIVDEALQADVIDGGAETPFRSVEDWAAWCLSGSDGDAAKALADEHGFDRDDVVEAVRDALVDRGDLTAINKPFVDAAKAAVRDADDLDEAKSALEAARELLGERLMGRWFGEGLRGVPTFGERGAPYDTRFVWSWDDERLLVHEECGTGFYFRDRESDEEGEVDEDELAEAFSEVEDGLDEVTDDARTEWTAETAETDAHEYVHAYLCDQGDGEWGEAAAEGTKFRAALDAKAKDYILAAIAERDEA